MGAIIITAWNGKGGAGKTTLTANLGAYLFQQGENVAFADFDAQASLTDFRRQEIPVLDLSPAQLGQSKADFVCVDTPPYRQGELWGELVRASHLIVIPSGVGMADLSATKESLKTINRERGTTTLPKVCIVLNRVRPAARQVNEAAREILGQYECKVLDSHLAERIAYGGGYGNADVFQTEDKKAKNEVTAVGEELLNYLENE